MAASWPQNEQKYHECTCVGGAPRKPCAECYRSEQCGDPLFSYSRTGCAPSHLPGESVMAAGFSEVGENRTSPRDLQRREHLDFLSLTPLCSRYLGSGFALSNQINPEAPQSTGIPFDHSCSGSSDVGDPMSMKSILLPAPLSCNPCLLELLVTPNCETHTRLTTET